MVIIAIYETSFKAEVMVQGQWGPIDVLMYPIQCWGWLLCVVC